MMDIVDKLTWVEHYDANPPLTYTEMIYAPVVVFTSTVVTTRFQIATSPQTTTLKISSAPDRNSSNWIRREVYSLDRTAINDLYRILFKSLKDVDFYVIHYTPNNGLSTFDIISRIHNIGK